MKKNLNKLVIASILALGATAINAQPYYSAPMKEYTTQITNTRNSIIEDFKVDIPNLSAGQVIRFYADGEPRAKASVKFNSSSKFWREIPLVETEPGRYTGSYTIRSIDELDEKTFTLNLTKGKNNSTAYYKPVYLSERNSAQRYYNEVSNSQHYRNNDLRNNEYRNPDFGVVTRVDVQDARPDQINFGGTAVGAVVGGLLGNQVGGGSGRNAATVIGAIAGGAAGNQVSKNIGTHQKIWNVSVEFQDGQTSVYQYPTDPQVSIGMPVKRENGGISRR